MKGRRKNHATAARGRRIQKMQSVPTSFLEGHKDPRSGAIPRAPGKGYDRVIEEVLGSELDGSGIHSRMQHKKMLRESFKQNESNIDHMEHYKIVVSELLSKKDDSFSNGVTKELSSTETQNKSNYGHVSDGSFPLFVEHINDLVKNDKKRLKHILNEITTVLNADVDEVDRDVQAMVGNGKICQDNVKELSAGLLGKLSKMAQSVDDLLNTAASRCRPMTTEEKMELGKRIRKLPEEALNRVVEIITSGKPESQSSEKITMNLGQLDDAILWRLYYHVEYVLKESNV